jgi:putative membrane protein
MKFIFKFILLSVTIFLLSYFVSGFNISSSDTLKIVIIVSILITLINIFIKPIIRILTIPINLTTFGLFSLVLNALFIWGVAYYVDGFDIQDFQTAFISSVIISIINFIFGYRD